MRSIVATLTLASARGMVSVPGSLPLGPLLGSAPLILGSGSATRKAILDELGLTFEVCKPGIDEKAIRYDDPEQLVMALGKAKAAALLEGDQVGAFKQQEALILTADQVVVCGDKILEKPESAEEARRFINGYISTPPRTVGSCVISDPLSGQQWAAVDTACVVFEPIPEAVIDELIKEGEIFHCAGGLMVEHPLVQPYIVRMEGSIDSIMGLRKDTVLRLLGEASAAREQQ